MLKFNKSKPISDYRGYVCLLNIHPKYTRVYNFNNLFPFLVKINKNEIIKYFINIHMLIVTIVIFSIV